MTRRATRNSVLTVLAVFALGTVVPILTPDRSTDAAARSVQAADVEARSRPDAEADGSWAHLHPTSMRETDRALSADLLRG